MNLNLTLRTDLDLAAMVLRAMKIASCAMNLSGTRLQALLRVYDCFCANSRGGVPTEYTTAATALNQAVAALETYDVFHSYLPNLIDFSARLLSAVLPLNLFASTHSPSSADPPFSVHAAADMNLAVSKGPQINQSKAAQTPTTSLALLWTAVLSEATGLLDSIIRVPPGHLLSALMGYISCNLRQQGHHGNYPSPDSAIIQKFSKKSGGVYSLNVSHRWSLTSQLIGVLKCSPPVYVPLESRCVLESDSPSVAADMTELAGSWIVYVSLIKRTICTLISLAQSSAPEVISMLVAQQVPSVLCDCLLLPADDDSIESLGHRSSGKTQEAYFSTPRDKSSSRSNTEPNDEARSAQSLEELARIHSYSEVGEGGGRSRCVKHLRSLDLRQRCGWPIPHLAICAMSVVLQAEGDQWGVVLSFPIESVLRGNRASSPERAAIR